MNLVVPREVSCREIRVPLSSLDDHQRHSEIIDHRTCHLAPQIAITDDDDVIRQLLPGAFHLPPSENELPRNSVTDPPTERCHGDRHHCRRNKDLEGEFRDQMKVLCLAGHHEAALTDLREADRREQFDLETLHLRDRETRRNDLDHHDRKRDDENESCVRQDEGPVEVQPQRREEKHLGVSHHIFDFSVDVAVVKTLRERQPSEEGAERERDRQLLREEGKRQHDQQKHHSKKTVVSGSNGSVDQKRCNGASEPENQTEARDDGDRSDPGHRSPLSGEERKDEQGESDEQILYDQDARSHRAVWRLNLVALPQEGKHHRTAGKRDENPDRARRGKRPTHQRQEHRNGASGDTELREPVFNQLSPLPLQPRHLEIHAEAKKKERARELRKHVLVFRCGIEARKRPCEKQ